MSGNGKDGVVEITKVIRCSYGCHKGTKKEDVYVCKTPADECPRTGKDSLSISAKGTTIMG